MRFSSRLPEDLSESPLARALSTTGALDLTVSNPSRAGFVVPEEVLAALREADVRAYDPDPAGLLVAREAVASYAQVPSENVLLTASTSEAYALIAKLLCDPGESIAVPAPSYPLVPHLLALEGLSTVRYDLVYRGRYEIDLTSLQRTLIAGARAVVLISPNNPTGNVPRQTELAEVLALCRRYDVPLILDEVFAPYGREDGPQRRLGRAAEDVLCFTLDGLSKAAALPQLKLSWITLSGPPRLRREAFARLEWMNDAYLSVGTQVQRAAPAILAVAPAIQRHIRARLAQNRDVLSAVNVRRQEDDGGWYAVLDIGAADEEELVLRLAREHRVLVQPGFFYDFPSGNHLVVSLLTPPEAFRAGMARVHELTKHL